MGSFRPSYIGLYDTGELQKRASLLNEMMSHCEICPRKCGVNRASGEFGECKTGDGAQVAAAEPHTGEEPQLVGEGGSGTIFLSNCPLKCVFCQNFKVSQQGEGDIVPTHILSSFMIVLQKEGCHNINFVSPTHQLAAIVSSLPRAVELGLELPLVYNSAGYDSVETLKLVEGIFDIYMPDIKYTDDTHAMNYSGVSGYSDIAKAAIKEMHRQVGGLVLNDKGVAEKGLIVRHLVMPNSIAGTVEAMRFIAEEISPYTYVNLMDQYRPCFNAADFKSRQFNSEVQHLGKQKGKCYPKCLWQKKNIYICLCLREIQ